MAHAVFLHTTDEYQLLSQCSKMAGVKTNVLDVVPGESMFSGGTTHMG